jgi:cytochrome c biogenesis protein CcmG, thiol:disulfide interchange protein DsbE
MSATAHDASALAARATRLAERSDSLHRAPVADLTSSSSTIRRSLPWLALGIFVLWAFQGLSPRANFAVGTHVPSFTATLTDGSKYQYAPAPKQVTVLNFWASYCGPCKVEAPLFSHAHGGDVQVVGLSTEDLPSDEIARRADALGMHYRIGVADPALMSRFHVQSLPTTYVVDPNGTIVLSRVGAVTHDELETALNTARAMH